MESTSLALSTTFRILMQFPMFSTFLHFVHGTYLDEQQQPIGWTGRYVDVIKFTYIVQVVSYLTR